MITCNSNQDFHSTSTNSSKYKSSIPLLVKTNETISQNENLPLFLNLTIQSLQMSNFVLNSKALSYLIQNLIIQCLFLVLHSSLCVHISVEFRVQEGEEPNSLKILYLCFQLHLLLNFNLCTFWINLAFLKFYNLYHYFHNLTIQSFLK